MKLVTVKYCLAFDICLFMLQNGTGPSWPAEIRMDRERKSAAWVSGRRKRKREGGTWGEEKMGHRQLLFSSPKWKLAHVTLESGVWPGHRLFSVVMN